MYAKVSRERNKFYLELTDKMIGYMEKEELCLMRYLLLINLLKESEFKEYQLQIKKLRAEAVKLKPSLPEGANSGKRKRVDDGDENPLNSSRDDDVQSETSDGDHDEGEDVDDDEHEEEDEEGIADDNDSYGGVDSFGDEEESGDCSEHNA